MVLWVLVLVYLVASLGGLMTACNLVAQLDLVGSKALAGQVWRLFTYAVLSPGFGALIGNCVGVVFVGFLLEKFWSRREFWLYGVVTAAGAGLAHSLLHSSDGVALVGPEPVFFAMLIAIAFVRGREVVQMAPLQGMLTWHLVAAVAGIQLVGTTLWAGLVPALVLAAGALTGYLYLWLRHKWLMNRDSRVVESQRINRLEL